MTTTPATTTPSAAPAPADARPLWRSLLKLARPKQWAKSAFVLIGPAYGFANMAELQENAAAIAFQTLVAAAAFSLTSSCCYVLNDIHDREADRLHPRKRRRPIASGQVSVGLARVFAVALFLVAAALLLLLPGAARGWVGLILIIYVANVFAYSFYFKHKVIGDVVSLAIGFVLRVMAGCAAIAIVPTTWLLNVTFFLSMFLAFGKRLGERRTLADDEGASEGHRAVQALYTDAILQMSVVVTAVATLMTYAAYVVATEPENSVGFNLLWLTLLPATYGLLRCIVLLESGRYDDPTELAYKDRGFIAASLMFGVVTVGVFLFRHLNAG